MKDNSDSQKRLPATAVCLLLTAAVCVLFVLSLCLGAVSISPEELLTALKGEQSAAQRILQYVRLPRAVGAVLCGAALGSSGAIIQTVLHNPLGSPNVLGMNAGAGLFVIITASLFPAARVLPLAAFSGAFLTLILVTLLGKKAGGTKAAVLLSGVAAGTFFTACADAVTVLLPDTVYSRTAFKIGSLSGIQMNVLIPSGVIIALSLAAVFVLHKEIDILSLGEETAGSLGLHTGTVRVMALVLAALLCGAGICFAGLVGFVGLIVPHIARTLTGTAMRPLAAVSALSGAALVLLCDLLSRMLFAPYELPVGILLSLIGGPFFIALLFTRRRNPRV
ncbi:MAG: iron ABC transporter permease [Treponema sp.]|nr:iron ABC transporter permease [Treponema sp.]